MYKNIEKQVKLSLKDQVAYQPGQVVSKTLVQNDKVSMTIFSFDKGEEISTHAAAGDAMVTVLEGKGRFTVAGDVFYLEVLDEILAYQVDAIHTVLPHDTTYLGITTGEDYCTLVTCTPFGVNTHRLLVRGSRIPYEEAEEIVSSVSSEEGAASTWEEKYFNGILTGLCIVGVISIIAVTVWYIRRR